MKRLAMILALVCCGAGMATEVRGEWILNEPYTHPGDSGQPFGGGPGKQAMQFFVSMPTIINSIEAFMTGKRESSPGSRVAVVSIHRNGSNNTPTARVFSAEFAVPDNLDRPAPAAFSWQGVSGISWLLQPEWYWVVFSDDETPGDEFRIRRSTRFDNGEVSDARMLSYTQVSHDEVPATYDWVDARPFATSMGVRVAGHAVPEPNGLFLFSVSAAALAIKKRHARQGREWR